MVRFFSSVFQTEVLRTVMTQETDTFADIAYDFESKARALFAPECWVPPESTLERGTAAMLLEFEKSSNVPIERFAELSGQRLHSICEDIRMRRLLALNMTGRGTRLPNWQLEKKKLALTCNIMQSAVDIDNWTVYFALSQPLEGLGRHAPIEVIEKSSFEMIETAVFNSLGIIRNVREGYASKRVAG